MIVIRSAQRRAFLAMTDVVDMVGLGKREAARLLELSTLGESKDTMAPGGEPDERDGTVIHHGVAEVKVTIDGTPVVSNEEDEEAPLDTTPRMCDRCNFIQVCLQPFPGAWIERVISCCLYASGDA